jgi:hypothetical protein
MEWDKTTADMEFRAKMERKYKRSRWYARLFDATILILAVLIFVATVWNFEEVMNFVYGMMGT